MYWRGPTNLKNFGPTEMTENAWGGVQGRVSAGWIFLWAKSAERMLCLGWEEAAIYLSLITSRLLGMSLYRNMCYIKWRDN